MYTKNPFLIPTQGTTKQNIAYSSVNSLHWMKVWNSALVTPMEAQPPRRGLMWTLPSGMAEPDECKIVDIVPKIVPSEFKNS